MKNKKAGHTEGFSFGSSAISCQDPLLSAPFSRRDRLYRELRIVVIIDLCIPPNTWPVKFYF